MLQVVCAESDRAFLRVRADATRYAAQKGPPGHRGFKLLSSLPAPENRLLKAGEYGKENRKFAVTSPGNSTPKLQDQNSAPGWCIVLQTTGGSSF